MPTKAALLFDLIESEANVNVFIDRPDDGFVAEGAAIVITSGLVGHLPKQATDKWTVWFGRGILKKSFRGMKKAYDYAFELMDKANRPVQYRFEGKDASKFKKKWDEHNASRPT